MVSYPMTASYKLQTVEFQLDFIEFQCGIDLSYC